MGDAFYHNIKRRIKSPAYRISVSLEHLSGTIDRFISSYGLQMNPEFQRGHVWTEEQQVAFVEYIFTGGGPSGKDIFFNCRGWMNEFDRNMVLVDGLQRITALLRFINNEIPLFGHLLKEYDRPVYMLRVHEIFINVNDLKTEAEVLQWYLEMNTGGTPHTIEEIARVTKMLEDLKEGDSHA